MYWVFVIYVVFLLYVIWQASRQGTLYVFSPLVLVYLPFAAFNIYPLVTYDEELPANIVNVTLITCAVNMAFMLAFRKQFLQHVQVRPDRRLARYAGNRKAVACFFLGIIVSAGFYTGVTQMLLAGIDVEDFRMTSDVGMGFVRAIPFFGLPYLVTEYFITSRKLSFWKAAAIGFTVGLLCFLSSAARGSLAAYIGCFFVWVNLRYRGFRWYEFFFIFYLLKPVIATALQAIRMGNAMELAGIQLFDHEKMIFGSNTVRLARYMEQTNGYLWGESYVYPIFRLIPRFLWPDKPMAIDYKYKEMVEMDFDGGGIYTTEDFDMFLNFGYFYVIEYVLWLLLIHWMYRQLARPATGFADKMLILVFLSGNINVGTMIMKIQLYFLFLLIFYFVNRKWRVI